MARTETKDIKTQKEFAKKQPIFEQRIALSRDKKWVLLQNVRTDIVHINYLKKILEKSETT